MRIVLPVCKAEVPLAVWTWAQKKEFFAQAKQFLAGPASHDDWMEQTLRENYSAEVCDLVMRAAPDAIALYNDTVRYNQSGADAVKNCSSSGVGVPTQGETDTAERAGSQTPKA